MRRIICEVFHPQRTKALSNIALVMAAWWIAQNLASLLVIRIYSYVVNISPAVWQSLDRISPIPHAVTSFSFLLTIPTLKQPEIFMHSTIVLVQMAIFSIATWMIAKQVFSVFGGQTPNLSFKRHSMAVLSMVPVFISLSFCITNLSRILQSARLPAFYSSLAAWAVPDSLALLLLFVFAPGFLFAQKGIGVPRILSESLLSTARWMGHLSLMVSIIAFLVCGICSYVFDPGFVSSGLYEPLRQAISMLGWMMASSIWIFTGFVYDRHVSEKLKYEL